MPAMIPGGSILVHQDYNHPAHPYIQLSMEVLRAYFKICVKSEGGSKIFFLEKELPQEAIDAAIELEFSPERVREAYQRIISETADDRKDSLRIAEVSALRFLGFEDAAEQRAQEVAEIVRPGERERWKKILGAASEAQQAP